MNFLDKNGLLYVWQKIKTYIDNLLKGKVDKIDGKGLSTNDFSTAEKNKLAGLNNYTLPSASAETLGGIKVGAGLAINEGILSATGGGTADSVDWSNVQNKPTKVSEFTNDSGYQTARDVNTIVENVVGAAPEALDTLKELSDALGNDPDFASTIATELSKKANIADLVAITNSEIDTIIAS